MKLSRARLKQIITEEVDRMEEVKNDTVQLAAMQAQGGAPEGTFQAQAQVDQVNGGSDEQILQDLAGALVSLSHLISGLSDKSMQAACLAPLNSLHGIIDKVSVDVDDRPNTTPTQWGESESAPPE